MFCKNAQRARPLTKVIRNTLVEGVLVPFCSVETFFCRLGLIERQSEFGFIAIEKREHQSDSGEVGVFNFQKPRGHDYSSDLHIRKISKGLNPQEVKKMANKT